MRRSTNGRGDSRGMEPVGDGIDQPLGQSRRRRKAVSLPWSRILLVFCSLAIFAASGAVALRERPFREPPETMASAEDSSARAESQSARPAGGTLLTDEDRVHPSLIRLGPDAELSSRNVIVIRDPSSVGQHPRLAHLPDRALIEESETGPLPARGPDGRRPFDAYARPWSGARGARIAVVIGGLGISQTGTQEAIAKLPSEITLAFAPLGNSLMRWMQEARREGHELILQVPMEPFGYPGTNPGRYTLLTQASSERNLENLRWMLSRMTNYVGVMNYMGGRFTADRQAMTLLMDVLHERGLAYFDDGTSARSLAQEIALAKGVPFVAGDAVIDGERERAAILAKLDELERIARARGFAVGGGSALEVTVDTVAAWAGEVTKRGIELVPVSAVTFDPERTGQ